jgi:hypothetical protein
MKNKQQIGDITDSLLSDVNVNQQIKDLAEAVQLLNENRTKCEKGEEPLKSKHPYRNILLWITGLSVVYFGLAVFLNKHCDFGITPDSVVITFAGILATFIVVSNYMQVKEIKDDFTVKSTKFESEIQKVRNEITSQYDVPIEKMKVLDKRIEELGNNYESINNRLTCLSFEFKFMQGVVYEGISINESINNYLCALEMALDESNRMNSILVFNKFYILCDNRKDEVVQIMKNNSTMDKIRLHKNYSIIKDLDNHLKSMLSV